MKTRIVTSRTLLLQNKVTFASDGFFFIQDGNAAIKVSTPGTVPKVGDMVEVKGRPALEGGRVIMFADGWKAVGSADLPAPRVADADSLVYAGRADGDRHDPRDVNWLRVEVVGRAMGRTENGFSMEVADGLLISVRIDKSPAFIDSCDRLHPKVSVRGVAELFLDQSSLFGRGRYVIGVRLCAASPDDVSERPGSRRDPLSESSKARGSRGAKAERACRRG